MSDGDRPGRLTVASYNVHGCVGTDRRRDVARVARVLRELDAQVIALQELDFHPDDLVRPEPIATLADLSGYQAIWAPTERSGSDHFGNAILTTLPIRSARTLDLSYKHCERRCALDAELEAGATRLRVIATHLGLRPSERRYQVQKILSSTTDDEGETLTVLLGDINEWFLPGRPLRWLHARFGYGPSVRTFPAQFPLLSLDRIWAHPPAALSHVRAHSSGEARRASDHLPVVAELAMQLPATR